MSEYVSVPKWVAELILKLLNESKWPSGDTRWQTVEVGLTDALKLGYDQAVAQANNKLLDKALELMKSQIDEKVKGPIAYTCEQSLTEWELEEVINQLRLIQEIDNE